MNFRCSNCGSKRLAEVLEDLTMWLEILDGGEGDGPGYQGFNYDYRGRWEEGGFVERYECIDCKHHITDSEGNTITDPEELYRHLSHPLKQLADCASNNEK